MSNYVRKIVHMTLIKKNYAVKDTILAYYKVEKRNEQHKLTISIEGLKEQKDEIYQLCIAYGKEILIKEIQVLKLQPINKIFEVIQIEEEWYNSLQAVFVISSRRGKIKDYQQETILIGAYKDGFAMNQLGMYKKNLTKELEYTEVETFSSKNNNLHKEGIPRENKLNEDKVNEEKLLEDKLEEEKLKEEKLKEEKYKEEKIKEEKQKENRKMKEDEERKEARYQKDKNKEACEDLQNSNTIEYIKKRLEEKEGLNLFDEIFEKNEKMEPFERRDENTIWVRIDMTDLVFLPLEAWMLMNNAFLINSYQKYKHLILGRNKKEGILKLGIPDIFYFRESILANICGFHEFICCKNSAPKAGEYGYWILKTDL